MRGCAAAVVGNLPVSGMCTRKQAEAVKHLREVFTLTKEQRLPGNTGREIDTPGRAYYERRGLLKYLVCPFAHTIGLHEAEAPFFGPNGDDPLKPGMAVWVDVSFFGHPDWHGARIEIGYEITAKGPVPFSRKIDSLFA